MERSGNRMRVLIAGGGVAALEALIALRDLAAERVDITLLAPDEEFVYRPHAVAQPFARGDIQRVPLPQVAADFGAELIQDSLAAVWPQARMARLGNGAELGYDRLLVALGARRERVFDHATTFAGPDDTEAVRGVLESIASGESTRIAFVVPSGTSWSLPLYELALMTAKRARELGASARITFVTPEERPLAVFGPSVATEVQAMLDGAEIRTVCSAIAEVPAEGLVVVRPAHDEIACDRIIALPRLRGIPIRSLPHDADGFLPIDAHARVRDVEAVFAAGDGTDFPVKQGGIACQQADVAAETIARAAGAPVEPRSFRPVLRGHLITGADPRFLRADLAGREGDAGATSERPLWWPPSKISGRYLAPYLSESSIPV
jgi:sulfide:quinone oxidoreductase